MTTEETIAKSGPIQRVWNYDKGEIERRIARMIEAYGRCFPDGWSIDVYPEGGIMIGDLRRPRDP